jgi:chitinase
MLFHDKPLRLRLSTLALVAATVAGCSESAPADGSAGGSSSSAGGNGAVSSSSGEGGSGSGGAPSTTTTSSGSSASSSASTGGGEAGGTEYAPYFYTWGWGNPAYAFTGLVDLHTKAGLEGITLAFVLSDGGCKATSDIQQHQSDVDAFRAAGGKVKASFGGANGTYLESACPDAGSLAQAIEDFVGATGITDLDFDVEQGGTLGDAINQKRSKALKMVQDKLGIKVALTLACTPEDPQNNPGGLSDASLGVVKSAVAAGVTLSHVNLMTMDYGDYYSHGKAMGDLAISALEGTKKQLQASIPGLGEDAAYRLLGVTPMIGVNDVSTEVFSLADAATVASYVKQKHLGLVAFWAINRDQPGSGSLALYSGVNGSTFDFHQAFKSTAP